MIGRNHVRHRDVGSAPPCISIVVAVAATIMLAMTTMHTSSVDAFHLPPISVPVHQQQRQQFGKVSPTGSVRRRSCALNSRNVEDARAMTEVNNTKTTSTKTAIASMLTAAMFFAGTLGLAAGGAHAVSGGGSDYAGTDISNQDFSNNKYSTKDFTQVIGRNTNFRNSKFVGCRFQNGYLIDADFDSADLTGVSFERTNMENVNLKVSNLIISKQSKSKHTHRLGSENIKRPSLQLTLLVDSWFFVFVFYPISLSFAILAHIRTMLCYDMI